MPSPRSRLLTQQHYAQQVALRAAILRDGQALWRLWTPGDARSWRELVATALAVLDTRHTQSKAVAARYFQQLSAMETGRVERPVLAPPLERERVERSLAQTGLVGYIGAKSRGLTPPAAAQVGFVRFAGALTKLALDGGRETIVQSATASRRARGFRRITSGNACEFCAGLADEGVGPEVFEAHDHCSCSAEPVFGG